MIIGELGWKKFELTRALRQSVAMPYLGLSTSGLHRAVIYHNQIVLKIIVF